LNLPHRYPFRFVDRVADGRAVVRLSAGSTWSRGSGGSPVFWLVEAVAQSAAALMAPPVGDAPDSTEAPLVLVAVEQARFSTDPADGESLEIRIQLRGRWGRLIRVHGDLRGDRGASGEVELVLAAS
jgi:3-hydroxymyristoyl/3-hydroxydecanoyl-(acyl carrier protein) dehydratase